MTRKPDFENILKICRREAPARPTLFEFFFGENIQRHFTGKCSDLGDYSDKALGIVVDSFYKAGYDYCTLPAPGFNFPTADIKQEKTVSLNSGAVITGWESFEKYQWPNLDSGDFNIFKRVEGHLPQGMKVIAHGPLGVLETAVKITGYENLCIISMTDPELTAGIFNNIGSRLLAYYQRCLGYNSVGAIIGNDDWGFKTQTMFSPEMFRQYVFPWHKKIVAAAHNAGRPAILHSCGNLENVYDDIIDDIKYNAKHSYEDGILPVEDFYRKYHDRIAIMGGIDVDFLCRSQPEEIKKRARGLLELTAQHGGYGLGSGNSIPDYVPVESYLAMISVCG